MSGRYLLDTNIVIALFDQEAAVKARLEAATAVYLPSIVLGELYFGAVNSRRAEFNLAQVEEFVTACTVVPVDASVSRHYGTLKAQLRKKGKPIPENDLWIAACAVERGFVMVSRDRHFLEIEDLQVEAW